MLKMEKHWIMIDKLKRKYYIRYEYYRVLYKSFLMNDYVPKQLKLLIKIKYNSYHRFAAEPVIKSRCLSSGRSYGVLSNFKLSRFFTRRLSHKGDLSGVKRSSW